MLVYFWLLGFSTVMMETIYSFEMSNFIATAMKTSNLTLPQRGLYRLLLVYFWLLGLLFDRDDGGNIFLRNVELHSYRCENTKSNTVSHYLLTVT
jgi:hypothetical protein